MKETKTVGRPRINDPKIKFDGVRLKMSTLIDIDIVSEKLGMTKSQLVQKILEDEILKQKKLLGISKH